MLELFTMFKLVEYYTNKNNINEGFNDISNNNNIPISWIIISIIIGFFTAYIAYSCNEYETPATRALSTIIAFFFSGFYLIYYFIVHVMFDRKCGSKNIDNIISNITKKK